MLWLETVAHFLKITNIFDSALCHANLEMRTLSLTQYHMQYTKVSMPPRCFQPLQTSLIFLFTVEHR